MNLFVDMDGVLADFDSGYEKRFGYRPCKIKDTADWDMVRSTPHFYRDLPPMPDLETLWNGVSFLNPTILTGVPFSVEGALENKREWVTKHLGPVPMIGCKSAEKSLHMKPGDIIIDDWEKYKHLWEERGGIWITHVNAEKSLEDLAPHVEKYRQARLHHFDVTLQASGFMDNYPWKRIILPPMEEK